MHTFPYRVIDLTHTMDEQTPSWGGDCGFELIQKADYIPDASEVVFHVQGMHMQAGIGTHMDAPAHCIAGGITMEALPLDTLVAPCVVINVADKADAHFQLSMDNILQFEGKHGLIPAGAFVIVHTGWDRFWNERERYRNEGVFPSISADAATCLVARDIAGLGIDTLSPDAIGSGYPVHARILGAGKYIVENVAHANELPPTGSFSIALPMKVRGAVEAPMRLIGLCPL